MKNLDERVRDVERAEELVRCLASALSARRIYSAEHPRIQKAVRALVAAIRAPAAGQPQVCVTVTGHTLEYEGMPITDNTATLRLAMCLEEIRCSGVEFGTGLTPESASDFLDVLLEGEPIPAEGMRLPGIQLFPWTEEEEEEKKEFPPLPEFDVPLLVYRAALDVLNQTMDKATGAHDLAMDDIGEVALWTAEESFSRGAQMVAPTQIVRQDKNTWQHSVNVFLIATAVLQPLARDPRELARFGQAAFLHDIGKSRIPREVLQKRERLTEAEYEIMKRHVEHGVDILASCPDADPLAIEVAYCHHMLDDGRGYPEQRAGVEIRPGPISDVVQVVDMFEALTAPRPYKGGLDVAEALKTILGTPGMASKRGALNLLVRRLTLAPPGSEVVLETGEHAIVLDVHPDAPLRPLVRFITDAKDVPLEKPFDVDLRDHAPGSGAHQICKVFLKPAYRPL